MDRRSFLRNTSLAITNSLLLGQENKLASSGYESQYSGSPAGHHIPDPTLPEHPNVIWIIADQFP
jgi:hypothetical protein